MDLMGVEIAKMHLINLIHGDLTTSNIMVRRRPSQAEQASLPSTEPSTPKKIVNAELPAEVVSIHFPILLILADTRYQTIACIIASHRFRTNVYFNTRGG